MEIPFSKMSISELASELDDYINEYDKWLDFKLALNDYNDDEIFYMMSNRDDIHQIVVELKKTSF